LPGRRRLRDLPYLLLILAPLFWSGNFIVGRAVRDTVPPVALAFWRWFGGFTAVIAFAAPHLRHDWRAILRHWPILCVLAATGIAAYNTFLYLGLATTTSINALLLQSTMPLVILVCSFALFGERPGIAQIAGVLLSLAGVLVIIGRGDLAMLGALRFDAGDLWVFAAVVSYALYSALLRRRPPIHALSFLAVTFFLGWALLIPFYLHELESGAAPRLDATTVSAVLYVAVLPSAVAYLCWNRGVELVGANRAGQFMHLLPVFGSVLAVLVLGEAFRPFHAAGAALIFCGIALAQFRPAAPASGGRGSS